MSSNQRPAVVGPTLLGLALGASPIPMSLLASFAGSFFVPFLAIGAGLLIGLRWPASRWRSIVPCALAAGAAWSGLLLALSGRWRQSSAVSEALMTAAMTSALAAVLLAIGVWTSTLDGRNQRSDEAA